MKIRHYGALTSAFLITLSTGAAQAHDCACTCPPKAVHHAAARPAPAHVVRRNADAEEYAQSFYDYHSSSSVSEEVSQEGDDSDWQVAPDDARIRFRPYRIRREPAYGYVVNDNDLRGGAGDYQNAETGGGGYGFNGGQTYFYGEAGANGPTYNSYGESFQNNPSSDYGRFEPPGAPHGYYPGGGGGMHR